MCLPVIEMNSVCKRSACYVLMLLTTGMTGVQLQEGYMSPGNWGSESNTEFPPTLSFRRYRNPQHDINHVIKPKTPHRVWVNFDLTETGTIRESKNEDTWVKRYRKEVPNHSNSINGKSNVLFSVKDGYSEGDEQDAQRNHFINDSMLRKTGHKLNESNKVRSLSDIRAGRVGSYQSDFQLGVSQHQVDDTNFSVANTSLVKRNGQSSHDRRPSVRTPTTKWSTELGSVTSEHQNNHETRPLGHQLSDFSTRIVRQEENLSIAGHQKSDSTIDRLAKEPTYRNINTGRQQPEDARYDRLRTFNIFEKTRFNDLGTSKKTRSGNVWDGTDLGVNRFSYPMRHRSFGTETRQDNSAQNRLHSATRPQSITAWHGEPGNYGKVGVQDRHESTGNIFDYDTRHRDLGINSEQDVRNHLKRFNNRFIEHMRYSDADIKSDAIQISGESPKNGELKHSPYSEGSQFGDVIWPSDTYTVTADSDIKQTASDSERHDNDGTGREKHDSREDKFDFHRNSFAGITRGSRYSSESSYYVPEFNQEHEFDSNNSRFNGTSWHSEYSLQGVEQQTTAQEEADCERPKNRYNDGAVSLDHGVHPDIATDTPDVVTRYTLPNGTRVVRMRRIVLYKKPGTPPQKDSPRTFADIAKGIIQKKVAKFLSLFTIVEFPNEPCQTSEGVNGTCYHHLQCRSLGGIASGSCARGYGICCYFEKSCGEITRQNCSYFVNPGFPAPVFNLLACILTVEKAHPDVSQIRLDFFMFELLGPTNGTCIEDQFIVTGQNTNSITPIICGINNGQHIYMDVDSISGPLRLNMLTMRGDIPRSFRIKVTQIKKGSPLEAPKNCFQYHRGVRGSIESFNYEVSKRSDLPSIPGYMNNLNYAICIHKEPGHCSVTYSNMAPDGTAYPLQLINVDQDGQSLIPPGQAGAEVFNCPDDYIVINGIRLCGERLNDASVQLDFTRNSPVTDISNGPFTIPVRTNDNTNGKGFRIDYWQNSCAS